MQGIELRSYQGECEEAVFADLRAGHKKLGVVIPTGGGKTAIFGSIIKRFITNRPNSRAAVVSHLGLLVDQTSKRFKDDWGIQSGILQADRMPAADDRCIITTMQSFRELDKLKRWAAQQSFFDISTDRLNIELVIVDECHYMGSESYEKILGYFPNAIVLGFTATPFRENKLMTNQFDKVSYTISMQELIDMGYLVPPKLHMTPFNPLDNQDMFAKIVELYKQQHAGEKAVVYCKSIDEAELLRNVLVDAGIESRAVTSKLTGRSRDELLTDFRNGNGPSILTTVDVLTAGFDSPNLRAIFMPHKVGSVTSFLQRVGRGLRVDTGKVQCDLYVGSDCPGIQKGFWTQITKKILNAGRKSYDNIYDEFEYGKEQMSREEYNWTKEVVELARKVKKKHMHGLLDMIETKELPRALTEILIREPGVMESNIRKKKPASFKQQKFLEARELWRDGMTSSEASTMIDVHNRSIGIRPKPEDVVQSGKHQGKTYDKVPHAYWQVFKRKNPGGAVYQAYLAWRRRHGLNNY